MDNTGHSDAVGSDVERVSQETKRSMKPDEYSQYFGHQEFCGNCGHRQFRYVPKGTMLDTVTCDCDNCGVLIRFKKATRS